MGSVCGIDQSQINKPGSDKLAKEDCPAAAADYFNDVLKNLRTEGKDTAYKSSRRAEELEQSGLGARDIDNDYKRAHDDFKCAANLNEVAAADTLKAKHQPDRCYDAQRLYENAGMDRDHAAVYAGMEGDHKLKAGNNAKNYGAAAKSYAEAATNYGEAARNFRKAHDDFKLAEDVATKAGKTDDAKRYRELADKAETGANENDAAAKKAAALEAKAEAHIKPKK